MSDSNYTLKAGKGNIMPNKKEDEKHDYYGSFCSPRDIKAGEVVKFQGYKNESQNGNKYIGLQILDKREEAL
jgi:hypothetical protein|tara:strand:+ start:882 stop:1097 length:216 start_codon:yes stop_codon:yes gene_type:complete